MGFIGRELGYRLLRRINASGEDPCTGSAYAGTSKLVTLLGEEIWGEVRDRTVIDFGCGDGDEVIEIAQHGAASVIGLDSWEDRINAARNRAREMNLSNVTFCTSTDAKADVVISLDSFEHFDDPSGVLAAMARMLMPDGKVIVSFGPTWYHPNGGHLFSVFPWAHLVFTEKALIAGVPISRPMARPGSPKWLAA